MRRSRPACTCPYGRSRRTCRPCSASSVSPIVAPWPKLAPTMAAARMNPAGRGARSARDVDTVHRTRPASGTSLIDALQTVATGHVARSRWRREDPARDRGGGALGTHPAVRGDVRRTGQHPPRFLRPNRGFRSGVTERPGQTLLEATLERLRPGRSLLVLDNCEHLVDDTADFLTSLLAETAELLVLTTSRARIGVPGERVVALPGLSLVAPVDRRRGRFRGGRAVLRSRANAGRRGSTPIRARRRTVRRTGRDATRHRAGHRPQCDPGHCRTPGRVDRSAPVAQRRTQRRRTTPLAAGGPRLESRTAGRGGADGTAPAGSVRGSLFDIAAAAEVTGLPAGTVVDLVGRLSDQACWCTGSAATAWALLETVRAYALEKLADPGNWTR